jgi:hypothetical protein
MNTGSELRYKVASHFLWHCFLLIRDDPRGPVTNFQNELSSEITIPVFLWEML